MSFSPWWIGPGTLIFDSMLLQTEAMLQESLMLTLCLVNGSKWPAEATLSKMRKWTCARRAATGHAIHLKVGCFYVLSGGLFLLYYWTDYYTKGQNDNTFISLRIETEILRFSSPSRDNWILKKDKKQKKVLSSTQVLLPFFLTMTANRIFRLYWKCSNKLLI